MRAEAPVGAVLRFWALRPRFWGGPLLAAAAGCWLSNALAHSRPEAAFLPAAALAVASWLWLRGLLAVTDPPRALLVPGWIGVHRRALACLAVGTAGPVIGFMAWHVAPVAPAVLLGSLAILAGFVLAARTPDRLLGSAPRSVQTGVTLVVLLLMIPFTLALATPVLGEIHRWLKEQQPAVLRVWSDLLAGERPLVTFGVAAAATGLAALVLGRVTGRGRRLFARRPFAETPALRRPPPPTRSVAPAAPTASIETAAPAWPGGPRRLRPPPRSAWGRVWLYLDGLPARGVPVTWLLVCPLCLWLELLLVPAEEGETRWRQVLGALGLVAFVGCLGSAPAAARFARCAGEPASLPRAVLLPRPRRTVYRKRLFVLFLSGGPAVLCLTLFFGAGGWFDATPREAAWQAAAQAACFFALLPWLAAFRFVDQFTFTRHGRWLRFALVPAFFIAWLGSCAAHPGGALGPGGSPDGLFLTIGVLMSAAGLVACGLVLRHGRRWNLTTR